MDKIIKFANLEEFIEHFNLNKSESKFFSISFMDVPGVISFNSITSIKHVKDGLWIEIKFHSSNGSIGDYCLSKNEENKLSYFYEYDTIHRYLIRDYEV